MTRPAVVCTPSMRVWVPRNTEGKRSASSARDTAPTTHTSRRPSSIDAAGVMRMPPAYERVLPTATSQARPSSTVPSTTARIACGR